ncbi:hypothetical protein KEJ27_08250 [Candidatus Bathyarchaeota archaeon]|nr:hypothetical protein [Candidatus Bathyarchaeota archaeon]
MKSKSLAFRFLEDLSEAFRLLNNAPSDLPFNPATATLSALILTGTAALNYDLKILIAILLVSIVLLSILNRQSLGLWIKTIIFASIWASIVSTPLPFITAGEVLVGLHMGSMILKVSFEGIRLMVFFTARVVASVAVFTAFIMIMGWRGIIAGFEELRIPGEFSFMLNLSIISIPIFLRGTLNMLLAREARMMRKSRIGSVWGTLTTITGELMLRGYERAWRLDKSIKARSFNGVWKSKVVYAPVRIRDVVLFSLALTVLLLTALDGVWQCC